MSNKMEGLKNIFPKIKTDHDKQLLYKLDANCIYCDEKVRPKILAQMKMILNRRTDLKSEVYNHYKNLILAEQINNTKRKQLKTKQDEQQRTRISKHH